METKAKSRKTRKTSNSVAGRISYLVKTKGYKETFDSVEKARNQFEILKKRAIKNKEKIKVELFERENGHLNLIDEVSINEAFYGED
ncbi:MAG: hypothetical protein ACOCWG_02255 [bacterium]